MHYDVFNGDADGICSLVQLRLSNPRNSKLMPDEPWLRRVVGVYANLLMFSDKNRAHALMILKKNISFLVSVSPPYNKGAADILCSMFGDGGRRGVYRIDNLPKQEKIISLRNLKNNYSHV